MAELSDSTLAPESIPASVVDALVGSLPDFPPGPPGRLAGQSSRDEMEAALELAILGALKQLVHSLSQPGPDRSPIPSPSKVRAWLQHILV